MQRSSLALRRLPIDSRLGLRERLAGDAWPAVVYAIGDVHGCLAHLDRLHAKIVTDALEVTGEKLIICLGDYIDRGPASAGVVGFLRQPPPPGFQRICLAGNHEDMLLDHYDDTASSWIDNGGAHTLASYGISPQAFLQSPRDEQSRLLRQTIPPGDIGWMRSLPVAVALPGACFVHAGLREGLSLSDQTQDDLLWLRPSARPAEDESKILVVHGHTPAAQPIVTPNRICIDTGAFLTGTLTAVRLTRLLQPEFIKVTAHEIFS
jgi:serine/threonine protein phosphatase 1